MFKSRLLTIAYCLPIFLFFWYVANDFLQFLLFFAVLIKLWAEWINLSPKNSAPIFILPYPENKAFKNNKIFYIEDYFPLIFCAVFLFRNNFLGHFLIGIIFLLAFVFWLLLMPISLKNNRAFYVSDNDLDNEILSTRSKHLIFGMILLLGFAFGIYFTAELLGKNITFVLFVAVWASDVGAYLVGKKWGRTAFAKKISPNKTWQGFFGGLAFSIVILLILLPFMEKNYTAQWLFASWSGWFVLLLSLIFAPLGDLFESLVKRKAYVKDSGRILGSHGGLLDRMDSWLVFFTLIGGILFCFFV